MSCEVSNDSLSHVLGVMGDSNILISSYIGGTVIIKHNRDMKCAFCEKTSGRCKDWLSGQLKTVSIRSLKEEDNRECEEENEEEEVKLAVYQGQCLSHTFGKIYVTTHNKICLPCS